VTTGNALVTTVTLQSVSGRALRGKEERVHGAVEDAIKETPTDATSLTDVSTSSMRMVVVRAWYSQERQSHGCKHYFILVPDSICSKDEKRWMNQTKNARTLGRNIHSEPMIDTTSKPLKEVRTA